MHMYNQHMQIDRFKILNPRRKIVKRKQADLSGIQPDTIKPNNNPRLFLNTYVNRVKVCNYNRVFRKKENKETLKTDNTQGLTCTSEMRL